MRGMRYCIHNDKVLCDLKHIRDKPYCLNCAISHGYVVNAHLATWLKLLPATHITTTELKTLIDGWR